MIISALHSFIKDVFQNIVAFFRNVLVFIVAAIIVLTGFSFVGSLFFDSGTATNTVAKEVVIADEGGTDKIVVAKLSGVILSEPSSDVFETASTVITPQKIQTILNQARKDSLVKAIVFDINSPGGSPVASDRIFELITNFREETSIPVLFVMGDVVASGGYYIASAADHIVANPATITGSIGVILESYNLEELYKKVGLEKTTFKQGQYKDILNEARDITEEERKIIEALNENTYNLFVSRVAQGRKIPEDQVKVLANGQVYSGRQAKDLLLVDSLGNMDEAIYQAKSLANIESFQVVEYQFTSFFNEIFGQTQVMVSPFTLLQYLTTIPSTIYQQR